MEKRIDKINYYLDIAETVASRSTCLRKKYGTVIVNHDQIISTGYSGAPRGRKNCCDIGYCTKKKLLPSKFNEQSKFNKKDTVLCHFCKRLLWIPYPHTENFKQWNVEEVHKVLKCYAFDKELEEYLKLKKEFESYIREEV